MSVSLDMVMWARQHRQTRLEEAAMSANSNFASVIYLGERRPMIDGHVWHEWSPIKYLVTFNAPCSASPSFAPTGYLAVVENT